MKKHIIPFSQTQHEISDEKFELVGIRGKRIFELAQLELPISPGFVVDSYLTSKIDEVNLHDLVGSYISSLEEQVGKTFGRGDNPLFLKMVFSPNLMLPNFPSVHNVGLNWDSVEALAEHTGEEFALGEFVYLLRSAGQKILFKDNPEFDKVQQKINKIEESLNKKGKPTPKQRVSALREQIETYLEFYGDKFPADPMEQLVILLNEGINHYGKKEMEGEQLAVLVQAMVYGNYGEESYAGIYLTRDKILGENKLSGSYVQNSFDDTGKKSKDINTIDKKIFKELDNVAKKIEDYFKEIRQIKFTVEQGNFWLVDQNQVQDKSVQAEIRTLLDLYKNKKINLDYALTQFPPGQLSDLLHAIIDHNSLKGMASVPGGLAGSPGAAVGQVYFSTPKLLQAYKEAQLHGQDTRMILAVPSSFAEDVKAIEVAQGVIAVEGGYSSHAPVVARSLGKVAVVNPDIKMKAASFTIGNKTVKEGDYITLDVPFYKDPVMYFGKADLVNPNPEKNGLLEFMELVEKRVDKFDVRVNGDTEKDALLARKFGAKGVGLCRTEHMFFDEKRINVFREMILATEEKDREKVLKSLKPMQRNDFYKIFKVMDGYPVTIRLLDAPLHEFIPRDKDAMSYFMKYLRGKKKNITQTEVSKTFDNMHEFNPMLGHRGCRVGITYPEIYEMQIRAIFEAAAMVQKEGVTVAPEIMVPIVINKHELKFIRFGKRIEGRYVKGVVDIYKEVMEEYGLKKLDYRVGTMIELPAAALNADEIAQYADFFSFGTNDLTQTTYGLSRDDMNSFYGSYTEYDILPNNPFQVLGEQVKELIAFAANRGRMNRPDLKMGLCGEHGADPENIRFLQGAELDYVSTSAYSIPIAKFAIAQLMIDKEKEE